MLKQYSVSLLIVLLVSCATHSYAMENTASVYRGDYEALKAAVFEKKGDTYRTTYNRLYPEFSTESAISLSKEFDPGSCKWWTQGNNLLQTQVFIQGRTFHVEGAIADILYDYKKQKNT